MRIPAFVLVLALSAVIACASSSGATDPPAPTGPTGPVDAISPTKPSGNYTQHCADCDFQGPEFCCSCGPDGARMDSCVPASCAAAEIDADFKLLCTADSNFPAGEDPAAPADGVPATDPATGPKAGSELPPPVDGEPQVATGSEDTLPLNTCSGPDDCLGGFCVDVMGTLSCQTGEEDAFCNKDSHCKSGDCGGTVPLTTCQ